MNESKSREDTIISPSLRNAAPARRRREHPPRQSACYCATLRQATRVITQRYDRHLESSGLNTAQYGLLNAIAVHPGVRASDLGDLLLIDASTLSRTLATLRKSGWVAEQEGQDARERRWSLTRQGELRLKTARPLWRRAQLEMEHEIGAEDMRRLSQTVFEIAAKLAG